jgi:hypothetical protein
MYARTDRRPAEQTVKANGNSAARARCLGAVANPTVIRA